MTLSLQNFAALVRPHSSMSNFFHIYKKEWEGEQYVRICFNIRVFYFSFHPELCLRDKELLLGFVCVHRDIYGCVYIHIRCFASERNTCCKWSGFCMESNCFFTFKVFLLFSMLQTGILRKHSASEGFGLHAFLCSTACYCLADYLCN